MKIACYVFFCAIGSVLSKVNKSSSASSISRKAQCNSTGRWVQVNVNSLFDYHLSNMIPADQIIKMHPLELPTFKFDIADNWFTTLTGLALYGKLTKLSGLRREKNAIFLHTPDMKNCMVNFTIGCGELRIRYEELTTSLGDWKPIVGKILGTHLKVSVEVNLNKMEIHLHSFQLVKNNDIRVEVGKQSSFKGIIWSKISNVLIKCFKNNILKAIEQESRKKVQKLFQDINKFLRVDGAKLLEASDYMGNIFQRYSNETYSFDFTIAKAILNSVIDIF